MWLKWLPWRFAVRRIARARGFVDPISLLSHLHRFAQPSEVAAPLELLRAGVVFHARGLMNTGAIQHNLDWVWPYWVERQFDPSDESFIPRAFSITHVNLTHRNWTAVGWPDHDWLPIVDPRGLLTPHWDSWSIDAWIISDDGQELLPSRNDHCEQRIDLHDGVTVVTESTAPGFWLKTSATVTLQRDLPVCRNTVTAKSSGSGWLALCLRPYNPEGVSFIHTVELSSNQHQWTVNGSKQIQFDTAAERVAFSDYRSADVHAHLRTIVRSDQSECNKIQCDVGMATAAVLYRLNPNESRQVSVSVPLLEHSEAGVATVPHARSVTWPQALEGHAHLQIPNQRFQELYDIAVRTLILHSPGDVYPGPYTYKRFWFRDAAFILNAMLCAGLTRRVEPVLELFPKRQTRKGYFLSQEGEWDSNGEALWILQRYCDCTGREPNDSWRSSIAPGAEWILKKLLPDTERHGLHAGLLPAGFSAEHLGPNDYYYWDDFWAVAGLRSAAAMLDATDRERSTRFRAAGERLLQTIDRSIERSVRNKPYRGIPASPHRRMDAGAIGSIVAGYPLALVAPDDRRLLDTVEFLIDRCFYRGGFFQDMIHSGINAYLTLHVAQVLLRAGDARCFELMRSVAEIASPAGQWPEAIHPRTLGGCMGDGQHVWAAAEWVMMLRNCFVLEEADRLILGAGIDPAWLDESPAQPVSFGPTPTPFGDVSVAVEQHEDQVHVRWSSNWRRLPAKIEVRLPGSDPIVADAGRSHVVLERVPAR